jgi:hypothetical protein
MFGGTVRVRRTEVPQFLSQQWPQLKASGEVEANFMLENFTLAPAVPQFCWNSGGLAQLSGCCNAPMAGAF